MAPVDFCAIHDVIVEYRIDGGDWLTVNNWRLNLKQSQFLNNSALVELRSKNKQATKFHSQNKIDGINQLYKYDVKFTVQSVIKAGVINVWLVLFLLLGTTVIISLAFMTYKKSHNKPEQDKGDFKIKELALQQQSFITKEISSETCLFYLHLQSYIAFNPAYSQVRLQVGQLVKLLADMTNELAQYRNLEKEIEISEIVKDYIHQYLAEYLQILPQDSWLEIEEVSSRVSCVLIEHHFALVNVLFSLVKLESSSIALKKISPRKAQLSFVSKYTLDEAVDAVVFFELFKILARLLVNIGNETGVSSEFTFSNKILSWKIAFSAIQRWRHHLTASPNNVSQKKIELTPLDESNKNNSKLIFINLTQNHFANNELKKLFELYEFKTVLDYHHDNRKKKYELSQFPFVIAVFEVTQESWQEIEVIANASKFPVIVCYTRFEAGLNLSKLDNEHVLLLTLSPDSSVLNAIVQFNFLRYRSKQKTESVTNLNADEYYLSNQRSRHECNYQEKTFDNERGNIRTASMEMLLVRLDDYLEQHYADETLDVEKIAFALQLSSRQLGRKLKQNLNLTTAEYVRQFRLNRSLDLLREGYSINQVFKMTGFSTRSYFSTCFKKYFKVSPAQFNLIKNKTMLS
ncbi:helix-turn-helix domain-containing protein [Aliikangiella maris]|uniref:AraC family transcriptional regulator n=2 Tax=Aliikangiella maris TaxID=3162458 RepID=A0ABV3MJ04_9GAMM